MPTSHRFLVIVFTSVVLGTMATFGLARLKTRVGLITNRFNISRSRKVLLAKLVDLPLEVLVEILSVLEWKDILQIRQTCKRLRDASLARPVWLSLVQWYSDTVQPRPFWIEKPLDLHTDRELEYLILRWQSGKDGRVLAQPKKLPLSIPKEYMQDIHLLPGGRWLLFGARDGSVKYHDLNSPCEISLAVTLVPSQFDQNANTMVLLSVDMDPDAEYMTFNLGIMKWRMPPLDGDPTYPNFPRYARWIEVSRVTAYWDENGQVKGLRAERLACFREEYLCGCDSFTLGGRHVAYSSYSYEMSSSLGDGENIAVVDWALAGATELSYSRRLIWRRVARWLALLPDDRLLFDCDEGILLFDLSNAPVSNLPPTQRNQPPRQDTLAQLPLFTISNSPPYLVHDSIRFSILTNDGVKGLIVPRTRSVSRAIECVDLLSHPNLSQFSHLSYDRALLCSVQEPIVLQYAWPDEHSSSVVSHKGTFQMPLCSKILFDEYSCRLVTRGVGSKIESILDYSAT